MGASESPRDRRIAELAARQHGLVAHWQLLALGVGLRAIKRRLATGRLHRIHLGTYAVGHPLLTPHGRQLAAVLACGPDAVLSHRDAGALWELRPSTRNAVDVTAPGRTRRSRPGITVHRVRGLDPRDTTRRDGIPVTTVARTLLDLAEVLRPRELERAFEEAERLRLLDVNALEKLCRRSPGRHGLRPLTALLAEHRGPAPLTRSELESRFLDLCRDAGLPVPRVNVVIAGLEVDAVWPDQRLVVELDGHAFHQTRAAFERDRLRDTTLQLAGHRVVRVTWRRLTNDPEGLAAAIGSLLGRQGR
jgi:very-short-patch-repair endonuclease